MGPRFCRGEKKSHTNNIRKLLLECYIYYECLLSPNSPITVETTELGLAVFNRHKKRFQAESLVYSGHLWGITLPVSPEESEYLDKEVHPSMFGKDQILNGPISLVNHLCKGCTGYVKQQRGPIRRIVMKTFESILLGEDEQILVDYYNVEEGEKIVFGKESLPCKCPNCLSGGGNQPNK